MKYLKLIFIGIIVFIFSYTLISFIQNIPDNDIKIVENPGYEQLQRFEDVRYITYNYTNKDNKLIYSWIFDKNEMNEKEKINLDLKFNNEFLNDLNNLDTTTKILSFDHHGYLPNNTKVKVYVKDKYNPGDNVILYYYEDDLEILKYENSYEVDDEGYVLVDLEHCSDYLLTSDIINGAENNPLKINILGITIMLIIIGSITIPLFAKK